MNKNRRLLRRLKKQALQRKKFLVKAIPASLLLLSILCLLIAHFDFNNFYWLFIVGLTTFSFTTAYLMVTLLEHFLPSKLVNNQFWTGEGVGGKGLAGLICGILAIAIALGFTYLLKVMSVSYIK